jgi:cytochrome c-type protein NapC
MFGSTGILIALIVVTIVLAAVFLVRSSITVGATGKILAFVCLCALPALCIGTGMSFQNQRSKQTRFCISCHELQGKSLYLLNPNYIPAHHFQDHLVPPDKACFTCHTDYAIYGPFRDKLRGLWNISIQYFSTPPKTIHMPGGYNNLECLQCHAGTRDFESNLKHMAPIALLKTNKVSCISCHSLMHNVSQVEHMKMWSGGAVLTSVVFGASAPAPAKAKPGAKAGAPKAPKGGSAGTAAAGGKGIFDSHGCSGCHGKSGGGGVGPALTHISSQYPPAKLTALLKAPTARMKAAGMVPLTLKAADMKALVSYVSSFGGTSAASTAASPAAGAPMNKLESKGELIFNANVCAMCHGTDGVAGTAAAPALAGTGRNFTPATLTTLLQHPTALMTRGGMPAVSLGGDDLKALVAYVIYISASKRNHP